MKVIGDDIDTIKYMIKQKKEGKPILDPVKKELAIRELKKVPKELFTKSWYWLLAIVFVFCMGYLVGQYRENVDCNNFLIENYIQPEIDKKLPEVSPGFFVFPCDNEKEDCSTNNYTVPNVSDIPG